MSKLPKYRKRNFMAASLSDSGVSSILISSTRGRSNSKNKNHPILVLLTKSQELVKNFSNRSRFPDPTSDRSLLLECCFPEEASHKRATFPVEHWARPGSVNCNYDIFKRRYLPTTLSAINDDEFFAGTISEYLICIDSIERETVDGDDLQVSDDDLSKYIMISEIQDHMIASSILPVGVSGYWIRLFGQQTVFSLVVSLWKRSKRNHRKSEKKGDDDDNQAATKIDEVIIILKNTGPLEKGNKKNHLKKKKTLFYNNWCNKKKLQGTFYVPSFCSKETFIQISMCLGQCRENGQYDLFEEMYTKFNLRTDSSNEEQKLFLWIERSLCLAVQGKFPEAKKLLQEVVENVPRGSNKIYLLNRSYIYLAYTHVIEGNYGTAEECLMMLQLDRNNGAPYEDVGMYHMLRGMISMAFGKKVPRFSMKLFRNGLLSLQEAVTNFKKCLPLLFNQLCYAHIKTAQVLMCQGNSTESNMKEKYVSVLEKINTIESLGVDKLANRIKCALDITKAEYLYVCGRFVESSDLFSDTVKRATHMNFAEEKRQCEEIEASRAGVEYIKFFNSLQATDEENRIEFDSRICNKFMYDADQSSC